MYFENFSSRNKLNNKTLNLTVSTESRAIETESKTKTYTINEIDSTILAFFLWIACLSIVSWGLFKVGQKLARGKFRGLTFVPVDRIPCRNCRFFDKNQYLKCAVRPFTVLTRQAVNCSDFCSKDESYWQSDRAGEVKHGS